MRTIFEDILIAFGLKKSPLLESVEKTKRDLRETLLRLGTSEEDIERKIKGIELVARCDNWDRRLTPFERQNLNRRPSRDFDWSEGRNRNHVTLLPDMEHGLDSRGNVVFTGLPNQDVLDRSHEDSINDNFQAMDDFIDYQSHWD